VVAQVAAAKMIQPSSPQSIRISPVKKFPARHRR
jgi:hypothetical protein